jgi:hypothetical protein
MTKKYQVIKMEEVQPKSQDRKKQIIRFKVPEYPIFPEEIESD